MCECCSSTKLLLSAVLLLVFGICLVVVGVVLTNVVKDKLWEGIIDQRVVTSINSTAYDQWWRNDFKGAPPQWFKVYVFNVTNPVEVQYGATPKLDTVGPYYYDYSWNYFDIKFSTDGNTVDLYQWERYTFNENKSNGLDPKKDKINFISIPHAAVRAQIASDDLWWQVLGLDIISSVAKASPFETVTVDEYLWGYNPPFLKWLNDTVGSFVPINTFFSLQKNYSSEEECKKDKGAPNTLKTGKSSTDDLNQFVKLQSKSILDIWGDTEANTVKGSNGYGFSINIPDKEPLLIMVPETFRHVQFLYNGSESIQDIPLHRYVINQTLFNNVTHGMPQYFNYGPDGGTNMTMAMKETTGIPVPIIMTQPYFMGADKAYLKNLDFLYPNDGPVLEKHNTFLYVEPITGLVLEAEKRLQINVKVSGSMILNPGMKDVTFPVLWIEQGGSIEEDQANQWKGSVGMATNVIFWLPIGSYVTAGILVLLVCVMSLMAFTRRNDGHYYRQLNDNDIN